MTQKNMQPPGTKYEKRSTAPLKNARRPPSRYNLRVIEQICHRREMRVDWHNAGHAGAPRHAGAHTLPYMSRHRHAHATVPRRPLHGPTRDRN